MLDLMLYDSFIKKEKVVLENPIVLEQKKNNKNWIIKYTKVEVSEFNHHTNFTPAQNVRFRNRFHFKYFCECFGGDPCFRFESAGLAHTNTYDYIPLPERLVTTPHFHKYDEHGNLLAYKTEELKDEAKCKAILSDINLALAHFCHETNLRSGEKKIPEIGIPQQDLLAGEYQSGTDSDPLQGVSFE